MNLDDQNETTAVEHQDAKQTVDKSRRSFAKAGVFAPVVMTLASRPALGAKVTGTCFTPSRSLSRNTSLTQGDHYGQCSAESPGYWKNLRKPCPIDRQTVKFHSVFNQGPYGNYGNKSFLDVLSLQGNTDNERVAFHIAAAYLNQLSGWLDSNITAAVIIGIWNEFVIDGTYSPVAGVDWDAVEIKNYLLNNYLVK